MEGAQAAFQKEQAAEQSVKGDVFRAAEEIRTLQGVLEARFAERGQLAIAVSAIEQKIQERRRELGAAAQQDFDLSRSTRDAQAELDAIQRQRATVANTEPEVVELKNYPTPLGKTVDADEAHFQLRGGRIVCVPVEDLVKKLKADAQQKVYKLRDQTEMTETIGPIDGFRMRYTLERVDTPAEEIMRTGRGGSMVRMARWQLLPVANDLGESIDEAKQPGSQFQQTLGRLRPGRTTVTLWVYPDSFATFRATRDELYRLGFAVAGRPLPEDVLIGGSPDGSKSSAE
jgi:hypothetical protein